MVTCRNRNWIYMCSYYIYDHHVFLQPSCLLSPDSVHFTLSPPFLPSACLLCPYCVVIVASIFLSPSLTLSFQILHMLFFTMRCIFCPWIGSVLSCFSEGQITANGHSWLMGEGLSAPSIIQGPLSALLQWLHSKTALGLESFSRVPWERGAHIEKLN